MKTYLSVIILMFAFIVGCTTQNRVVQGVKENNGTVATDTVRIANDDLEYEIIIIDPGFTGWLNSRARQRGFYDQQYLENKNQMWVTEWNIRTQQPQRYGEMYQMRIDYEPSINYGYEVNYLLYNYLVYFQQTNKQRLGGVVPQF